MPWCSILYLSRSVWPLVAWRQVMSPRSNRWEIGCSKVYRPSAKQSWMVEPLQIVTEETLPCSLTLLEPIPSHALRAYAYAKQMLSWCSDNLIINPIDRHLLNTVTQQEPFWIRSVNYSVTSLFHYASNQKSHRSHFPLLVHIPGFCLEQWNYFTQVN